MAALETFIKQYHTQETLIRKDLRRDHHHHRERERERRRESHARRDRILLTQREEEEEKKRRRSRLALTLLQHPATKSGVVVSLFFLQLKQHRPFSFFFGQRERGNVSKKSSQVLVRV